MNALELRRRTLGKGAYKKTVEGNPAIAQGSLARMYPGIEMQGWTEQDSTTGAQLLNLTENTVTNSGITCVSEGSIITISGERVVGSGGRLVYVTSAFTLQPGTYRFSYEKFNDVNSSISNAILMKQADNEILDNTFTLSEETNLYIGVNIVQGKTADNAIIRCMINAGSEAIPYEPYTGGKPSPSPEYPQKITSAGNWNETAQKWEYEIEISNAEQNPTEIQTVTLQSDRPLTKWDKLEKRNGQWGWVYKSNTVTLDGSEDEKWTFDTYVTNKYSIRLSDGILGENTFGYCNRFIFGVPYEVDRIGINVNAILWIAINWASSDLTLWKNYLARNPITVIYPTSEETFVPLSESEQEAMNALHTFRPTTVLSNDCGCNMTLTYKTKKSMEVAT